MTTTGRPLTTAQSVVLGAAAVAMLGIGILGATGTYSNLTTVFPGRTALGAVAAGEGATLILALVYVGLTMLGQTAPIAVRLGLWALPAVAATVGAVSATGPTATVVYAVTPLAMCTAAEGAGLLARRIVVWTTGVDIEARRRGAAAVRRLAYEQARAQSHPSHPVRWIAERRAWRLAARVGADDTALDELLLDVQRERLAAGADTALAAMFGTPVTPARDAVTAPVTAALPAGPEPTIEQEPAPDAVTPTVTPAVTQASAPEDPGPEPGVTPTVTPGAEPVTEGVTLAQLAELAELADLAAVAGVPVPLAGVPLDTDQLALVLRWLRYRDDPPMSYRQAADMYRALGFKGSEERVRKAWSALGAEDDEGTEPVG